MKPDTKTVAALLTLVLALTGTSWCQDVAKERLAILPFAVQGLSPEEGAHLAQRFTAVVADSKRFGVLPTTELRGLLQKLGRTSNDSCESAPSLSQLGKELGVGKIVHVRVVHRDELYVLNIRMVNVEGAVLLYSERVDYHGEFGTLLSEIIPEQALKLTKAHLDAKTPWLPATVLVVICLAAIGGIYARFRRTESLRKEPNSR